MVICGHGLHAHHFTNRMFTYLEFVHRLCLWTGLIHTLRGPHKLILAVCRDHFDREVQWVPHRLQVVLVIVRREAIDLVPGHHRAEDDLALGLPAARDAHPVGVDGHGEAELDDVCVGEALREVDVEVGGPRGVGEVEVRVPGGVGELRVGEPGGHVLGGVVAGEGVLIRKAEPRGSGDPDLSRIPLASRELRVVSDSIEVDPIPKFDGNNCITTRLFLAIIILRPLTLPQRCAPLSCRNTFHF